MSYNRKKFGTVRRHRKPAYRARRWLADMERRKRRRLYEPQSFKGLDDATKVLVCIELERRNARLKGTHGKRAD